MKSNRNLLLEFVEKYPGADSGFIKECGEINFTSVSTTLTKLCSDGLIVAEGIPKKFFLTQKGKKTLESGGLPGRRSASRNSAYSLQVATNIGDSFVSRKEIAKSIGCREENITWVLGLLEHMKAVDVIKKSPIGGRRKVKHYRKNKNMPAIIESFSTKTPALLNGDRPENYESSIEKNTTQLNLIPDEHISRRSIDSSGNISKSLQPDTEIQKIDTANELSYLESILSPEEFKGYLKGKILGQHLPMPQGDRHVSD